MIGTRVRGTRGEDLGTSGATIRKFTQAGETCHTINTSALIQTGTGCTFVDVHLTEVAYQKRRKVVIFFPHLISPLEGARRLPLNGRVKSRKHILEIIVRRFWKSLSPLKPWRHLQVKPFSWSMHVPAFWQGLGKQSFLSRSQFFPTHPGSQSQR